MSQRKGTPFRPEENEKKIESLKKKNWGEREEVRVFKTKRNGRRPPMRLTRLPQREKKWGRNRKVGTLTVRERTDLISRKYSQYYMGPLEGLGIGPSMEEGSTSREVIAIFSY